MQLKRLLTITLISLAAILVGAVPSRENSFEDEVVDVQKGQNFRFYNGIPVRRDVDIRYTDGIGGEVGRTRLSLAGVEEEGVGVVGVQGEAGGLLEKRGITYGWGEWEPQMQYLEGLSGPAIMSVAHEDDLDSGAWAGEAPNEIAKDRFWRGCDPRYVEEAV